MHTVIDSRLISSGSLLASHPLLRRDVVLLLSANEGAGGFCMGLVLNDPTAARVGATSLLGGRGQTVGPEMDPDREVLMATLSGAMVGPMDGIGLLNATRTMQSCRSDGVILKPDVPVTTDDWCFGHADPGCLVYSTYSEIPGYGRVTYPVSYTHLTLPTKA